MARTSQIIGMSEELKQALGEWAFANNTSVADAGRRAIAAFIDYDLEAEDEGSSRGRPRTYANKTERRAAARARNKERRELAKRLIEQHEREQRDAELAKMAASVAKREAKAKAPKAPSGK